MATSEKKILTLEGLTYYDNKAKEKIANDDAATLASAKSYADSLADNYDAAGTAQTKVDELANGQVATNTVAINAINNTTTGILAQAKTYADSKDSAIAAAKKSGDDAQADVDALEAFVGTIPEGYVSTTVTGYAKELADAVAANGYDDTALAGRVTTVEEKVTTLQGADTIEGSVAKQVKDAKTELTTEIEKKADKATTLAGYGIVDAYTKTETDTAIATAIANADHLKREIVSALPSASSADANTIYMVAKVGGTGEQQYDEYMLINGVFEKIGDSAVDLTDYATKEEVATAKSEATSAASADATTKANNALANAKTYADGLASNYATAEQGAKADTAVQSIASGVTNGSISVDGTDVAVKGLGTAAYVATSEFDVAGAANNVQTALNTYKTSNDAAVKANTDDIDALETKVAALESVSYTEITEAEIDALFAAE